MRLYKFGKEPERIQKPEQLSAAAPATRIGDTLERVLAESSSLPLGAIVLLSDGADNAGGIDLETIAAIRRQRIPVHTIGFGREHPRRDVEITDAVVPARALPQSKLTALVTFQSYGLSGSKTQARASAMAPRCWLREEVTLKAEGAPQTESLVFNCGEAGPKTLEIALDPHPRRREHVQNNQVTRLVNVEARKPRILYIEGEPRWEFKFIRRALDDYHNIELVTMLRTTQNKIYRQGTPDPGAARTGGRLPRQGRRSVRLPGADYRQRGGQLFHAHPAAVDPRFRGPPRRRPAVHGRARHALRRRLPGFAAGRPGAHQRCPRAKALSTAISPARNSPPRAPRASSAGWMTIPRATSSAGRRCRRWPTTRRSAIPSPAPRCCWYPPPRGSANRLCW